MSQEHQDWWSFDTYVAKSIADAAKNLRERGVSYPCDMTKEAWNTYLLSVEAPLRAYAELKFSVALDRHSTLLSDAQDALRKLAEHFGDWWD